MPLLLIFILIPIIEIALFIQVGGFLGLWPTLAIVILTAFIGTTMLRTQGMSTMARLQSTMQTGENPVDPMVHGALILVSGVLLLTPGFFTDGIGFALLIPQIRSALIKWGATKMFSGGNFVVMNQGHPQQHKPADSDVVDADYTVVEDDDVDPGDSGWTKH
ncbi:FxsA [Amylibacter sp. SFDW26]|uniref:FxsA family protein n=1 Tax=Amylibacter sp. SFDW26 TaxID=2652722 RepID=UPI001261F283|nr:FxsA family protein [Amylibacter sp. SFDW26]KAB7614573.1 FxsA [Amylibacter sp. SFDW26]